MGGTTRQAVIRIEKGDDRVLVSFPYNPEYVKRIKIIKGRRWHPEGKYWSFPNTNGTLERILKVFEGEEISYKKLSF